MRHYMFILLLPFLAIAHSYSQEKKETPISVQTMLGAYERVKLPPLSHFLESVYDHPSIKIYETRREEAEAEMTITKREWMNYFRIQGQYQYGRIVQLSSRETTNDPLFVTSTGNNQHTYSAGFNVSVPIGDLFNRSQRIRAKKAQTRRLDYEYEQSIEERKLKILEAYNDVLLALSTLKAKSDAAALYNAQMKISEQDFINGKIDIIALSLERGRRSAAVVNYQEGKAKLHNAITVLEMLSNVKIIHGN